MNAEHWKSAPDNATWATQDAAGVCIYWSGRERPYYSGYQWNGYGRICAFKNSTLGDIRCERNQSHD